MKTKEDLIAAGFKGLTQTFSDETHTEYTELAKLASEVTNGVIVEIGSRHGASACILASNSCAPVYCIDKWDLVYQGERHKKSRNDYARFLSNVQLLGLQDKIIPINAFVSEIAKIWEKSIGLLFIDGDHSYEGCRGDYEGFARYILPRHFLVFHDNFDERPGVQQVVREAKQLAEWHDWHQAVTLAYARRR